MSDLRKNLMWGFAVLILAFGLFAGGLGVASSNESEFISGEQTFATPIVPTAEPTVGQCGEVFVTGTGTGTCEADATETAIPSDEEVMQAITDILMDLLADVQLTPTPTPDLSTSLIETLIALLIEILEDMI